MKPLVKSYVQEEYFDSGEWRLVKGLSDNFYEFLNLPNTIELVCEKNKPGIKSHEIQDIILVKSNELGFKSEKEGLFVNYQKKVRPDFYKQIGETGIIIEVERGQSLQNNNIFKDFWKCHICEKVNYLFLFVPQKLVQNTSNLSGEKTFKRVCENLELFFKPENYTNVRGLSVFGY
jgi:hypothetical protein